MSDGHGCCGLHVTTCAKVVAILGIIGSICSIISAFFLWYYVPMAFVMLLTYAFVLVGIQKERPSYLLPAQIILGINLAINILIVIGFIVIAQMVWLTPITLKTINTLFKKLKTSFELASSFLPLLLHWHPLTQFSHLQLFIKQENICFVIYHLVIEIFR